MQVYFDQGIHNKHAVFGSVFSSTAFKNGYAVFAGLERIVKYLENLEFSWERYCLFKSHLVIIGPFGISSWSQVGIDGTLGSRRRLSLCEWTNCSGRRSFGSVSIGGNSPFGISSTFKPWIATKLLVFVRSLRWAFDGIWNTSCTEMDAAIWGTRAAVIGG